MKKLGILAYLLTGLLATVFANGKEVNGKTSVDVINSSVLWTGEKVTGKHEGTVALKQGELTFKKGVLKGGEFTIDMTSIACTDLSGDLAGKLVGHLKSDDFFGVNNYETAHLKITEATAKSDGVYAITADLTIKGQTHPVSFDAKVSEQGDLITTTADIKIDRTKYGIRYGSGSFFDNLGDKAISDEFKLNVKLVAPKSL